VRRVDDDVTSAAPVSAERRASRRFIWLLLLLLSLGIGLLLSSSWLLLLLPSCAA
jgi:hypothetical protein